MLESSSGGFWGRINGWLRAEVAFVSSAFTNMNIMSALLGRELGRTPMLLIRAFIATFSLFKFS